MHHRAPRPLLDTWLRLPRILAAVALVSALGLGTGMYVATTGMPTLDDTVAEPTPTTNGPASAQPTLGASPTQDEEAARTPGASDSREARAGRDRSARVPTPRTLPTVTPFPTPSAPDTPEESVPATSRTQDRTTPETTLSAEYPDRDDAVFTFAADEDASYACKLDDGAWTPCTSPTAYGDLIPGWHTFAVRATDAAGNVETTPAGARWRTTPDR